MEARLAAPESDGAPLRAHLQAAARQGQIDEQLREVSQPIPRAGAALWDAFLAMRSAAIDGIVTHGDIVAWQQLSHVRLSPWEVETLLCLDRVARDTEAKHRPKP